MVTFCLGVRGLGFRAPPRHILCPWLCSLLQRGSVPKSGKWARPCIRHKVHICLAPVRVWDMLGVLYVAFLTFPAVLCVSGLVEFGYITHKQVFVESLLCARPYARRWVSKDEQKQTQVLTVWHAGVCDYLWRDGACDNTRTPRHSVEAHTHQPRLLFRHPQYEPVQPDQPCRLL